MPTVRSILKPTIPLSPPKAIPPHPNPQKASHTKAKPSISPRKAVQKPAADDDGRDNTSLRQSGLENLPNPFDEPRKEPVAGQDALQETRVAVRTEEEQQAAVKERERQEMINRRDARRKSLGKSRTKELYHCLFLLCCKQRRALEMASMFRDCSKVILTISNS